MLMAKNRQRGYNAIVRYTPFSYRVCTLAGRPNPPLQEGGVRPACRLGPFFSAPDGVFGMAAGRPVGGLFLRRLAAACGRLWAVLVRPSVGCGLRRPAAPLSALPPSPPRPCPSLRCVAPSLLCARDPLRAATPPLRRAGATALRSFPFPSAWSAACSPGPSPAALWPPPLRVACAEGRPSAGPPLAARCATGPSAPVAGATASLWSAFWARCAPATFFARPCCWSADQQKTAQTSCAIFCWFGGVLRLLPRVRARARTRAYARAT